jgi:hypothetical protein
MRRSPTDSRRAGSVPPQGGASRIIPLVGLRHLFGEPRPTPVRWLRINEAPPRLCAEADRKRRASAASAPREDPEVASRLSKRKGWPAPTYSATPPSLDHEQGRRIRALTVGGSLRPHR